MDVYDGYYFRINKRILEAAGLWPYANRGGNLCKRTALLMSMMAMMIPQFIRFYKYFGKDVDKILENLFIIFYVITISAKVITGITAEEKMKIVYESTAKNFETIVDEEERNILIAYSERGRILTVTFIIYMLTALVVFTILPMTPIILDKLIPLNESRPLMFICNGDFFVDSYVHYRQIYLFDVLTCSATVFILCSVDPMYAAIVEHCLALFAIVQFRLNACTKVQKEKMKVSGKSGDNATYNWIVETIQLHNKIIKFTRIIETSYTQYFLLQMGATIMLMSTVSVIILIKRNHVFECTRYVLIIIGVIIHMFYLTWPSQKIIDYSSSLFQDTYSNEWYESSIRCKNLLRFMALRCVEPCQLTAGGVYIMNFINFIAVIKTSASYITLLSSLR